MIYFNIYTCTIYTSLLLIIIQIFHRLRHCPSTEIFDSEIIKKANMASAHQHPIIELRGIAKEIGHDLDSIEFARHMDAIDPLRGLREDFHYPKNRTLELGLL